MDEKWAAAGDRRRSNTKWQEWRFRESLFQRLNKEGEGHRCCVYSRRSREGEEAEGRAGEAY